MIKVSFQNLEKVRRAYDPKVVEKATRSAIKKLSAKASTAVSKEVRRAYAIKAGDIRQVLRKKQIVRGGVAAGFLIYTSKRLSLRYFTPERNADGTSSPKPRSRPKVTSRRGTRYGVRIRKRKDRSAKILPGAFWGRGQDSGVWQVFKRRGAGKKTRRS